MKKIRELVSGWTPEHWNALVREYLPAAVLTDAFWQGKPVPCPVCGGRDRFCYDNRGGRGDWFCRQCAAGGPMAGDGLALVHRYTGLTYGEIVRQLSGAATLPSVITSKAVDVLSPRARRRSLSPEARLRRVLRQFAQASPLIAGDHAMRYLEARVPGLTAPIPDVLRLAHQTYWHDGKPMGKFPTIVAAYSLPDGRLATVHRTTLDPREPRKAIVRFASGEILPAKRNEVSAFPLDGGAVRLMQPYHGELGVAEGIETAYAAYMLFGVPTWACLNRVQLSKFAVPSGLDVRRVHIFADFDEIDSRTLQSPGIVDALTLQRRLRAAGIEAVLHRPKIRGTDFCDEWSTACIAGKKQRLAVSAATMPEEVPEPTQRRVLE
ncbi:primase-helicase zinc-binding domain-containing protein [Cupriavidus pauculus]|uniref:DUF7146 domain-containing protein n=1 Tax=Cupriavidus pauculus TaxID=82633 RepID=UPI001EE25B92|nr:primase-helicase zinc-binding domain-containing protein [Cupriavidus pauculus]GJG97743.1 zinc-binding protein [Cupriavidus pauculus]